MAIRKVQGDIYQVARVEGNIGVVHYDKAEWTAARTYYERARTFWQAIGHRDLLAHTSLNLGNVALCLGEWTTAQQYYAEALALWSDLGMQRWIALCHNNLGLLAIEQLDWPTACQHLVISQELAIQDLLPETLYALAEMALGEQHSDDALNLAQQALALATQTTPSTWRSKL